jgi:hypothetical protein
LHLIVAQGFKPNPQFLAKLSPQKQHLVSLLMDLVFLQSTPPSLVDFSTVTLAYQIYARSVYLFKQSDTS